GGAQPFSIATDTPWITVTPALGKADTNGTPVTITANTSVFTPPSSMYAGNLYVTSGAITSQVPIELAMTDTSPQLLLTAQGEEIDIQKGTALKNAGSFQIQNPGGR